MPAIIQEWLNVVVRIVHVIAAIMWIGDSFLFMWMDSHLEKPTKPREGDVAGELWMTHSGGFYEVVKLKSLAVLPAKLYWFKWESYTTWLSGFLMLIIVYHLNGASMLIDPAVSSLTPPMAIALSLGLLPLGYGIYELLWKTPLAKNQYAFGAVGLLLITGVAFVVSQLFSGRAAYLQTGAMLGTIMSANVFLRIIPSQKYMLAQTAAGQPVDTTLGLRAKGRSIQNHYLTLPVLFLMLSNHFPSTYGNGRPWLVLGLMVVFGAGLKYFMNKRRNTHPLALAGTALALGLAVFLTRPASAATAASAYEDRPTVSYATVETIVNARCVSCHAAKPSSPMFAAPPQGITYDTPEQVQRHAERMFIRAVTTKTMPLGNLTGMTDEERELFGAWFAQGADIHAAGPSQLQAPAVVAPIAGDVQDAGTPTERAAAKFAAVCSVCHGASGAGDGPAAAALNPKPRNFGEVAWQEATTDEALRKVILEGGAAVGKSPTMPANPDLASDPETLGELVKLLRGMKKP